MKKILVIGCPGSGKSTFSRALHELTGIDLYHLDRMYWNPDRTTVDRGTFLDRLSEVLSKDQWIVDGNYANTLDLRLRACDTVIFLDYPPALCLEGIRQRRGTARSDLPWVEQDEDAEFMEFVKNFAKDSRPRILALLERHREKRVLVFTDRGQADEFLRREKL